MRVRKNTFLFCFHFSETLAADKTSGLAYYKSESKIWKIIGIVSISVAFIALALGSYSFASTRYLTQGKLIYQENYA